MSLCQAQFQPDEEAAGDATTDRECCSRDATVIVGHLQLCDDHALFAMDGLLEYDGRTADRGVVADVRARPDLFPHGVFRWADGFDAVRI